MFQNRGSWELLDSIIHPCWTVVPRLPNNIQAEGKKLGLVGWVQNTGAGTVQGQLQGPRCKVKEMQVWLKSTGSPKSNITKAEFKNEKTVNSLEYSTFNIVK
ncbi:acylphosphatase-1 [Etheostoma spectabile]|uniref:acylphosphatase-1 n=1 Tax=Etheostoma spectabile TaxID=54343 RepID=UPI0013AEBDCC|nr:acylphosphatase-1 [Etheostoma spectabile]